MHKLFRTALSLLALAVMTLPAGSLEAAYSLGTPANLQIVGGQYTNDNTPTFTWGSVPYATWYEYTLTDGTWRSLGNVTSFTSSRLNDGWYTLSLRARDNYNNYSYSNAAVTFEVDTQGPTVPELSVSNAYEDEVATLFVTPYGESQALQCRLIVDGQDEGYMDRRGNTFSSQYTFADDDDYRVFARCTDADGNTTDGASRTISVSGDDWNDDDFDEDSDHLDVPRVTPSSADEDEETEFTVRPTGDYNITECWLYVDGRRVAQMDEESTNVFVADYTFSNDGEYDVYATCEDSRGNEERGDTREVSVSPEDDRDDDDQMISVPRVSPSSAVEDRRTEITVRPTGDYNITECALYVEGSRSVSMDEESTNFFTADYTFTQSGSYTVYARCEDSHGNTDNGDKREITVSRSYDYEDDYDDEDDFSFLEGSLIKTACPANSLVSDPCRAVYYYGEDGYRHAFPNESTFFTWYDDFDDVETITKDEMNDIPLGENVTYRPGSVLLRFESSTKIYGIEEPNELREYTSSSLLRSDYGSDYSSVVVTVPDSLFSSYERGNVIDSSSDFDRTDAYYSVDEIGDLF